MTRKDENFFSDILNTGNANCGEPYQSKPPAETTGGQSSGNVYRDLNKDFESIGGASLEFGISEIIKIHNDDAAHINNRQGHILGDGLLVTSLNPTNKDGIQLVGVGGACAFCKIEADEMLRNGMIDIQEAERRSLFSTASGSQCQGCGRKDVCIRHCKPVDVDGEIINLCPACLKQLDDGKWVSTALNILSSLFKEEEQQPRQLLPGQQGGISENF